MSPSRVDDQGLFLPRPKGRTVWPLPAASETALHPNS